MGLTEVIASIDGAVSKFFFNTEKFIVSIADRKRGSSLVKSSLISISSLTWPDVQIDKVHQS